MNNWPRMRLYPLRLTGLPVICSLRTPSTRQCILCGLRKDFAKVYREILASQGVHVGMKGSSAVNLAIEPFYGSFPAGIMLLPHRKHSHSADPEVIRKKVEKSWGH